MNNTSVTIPFLAIYDPSDAWARLSSNIMLPPGVQRSIGSEGISIKVERVVGGALPDADSILVIVRDKGFNESESLIIKNVIATTRSGVFIHYLLVVDDEMLKPVSRSTLGFISVRDEIRCQYDGQVLLLQLGKAELMLPEVVRLLVNSVKQSSDTNEVYKEAILHSVVASRWLSQPLKAETWDDVSNCIDITTVSKHLKEQLRTTLNDLKLSLEKRNKEEEAWKQHAIRSVEVCLAASRGAKIHGVGAEDLIAGLAEWLSEVEESVELDFRDPPIKALKEWAGRVIEVAQTPEVVLPVVGIFSSGKTTIINHLLGSTPDGHAHLRTSQNHNTAMLTRFHRDIRNHLKITWQSTIDQELILCGDPSTRPLRAVADGRIESIQPLASGYVIVLRTKDNAERWITLDARHKLLGGINVGTHVKEGDPLSEGTDESTDSPGLLIETPSTKLTVHPWAISSMLKFLAEESLINASFRVRWREQSTSLTGRSRVTLREETVRQGTLEFADVIQCLREISTGHELQLNAVASIPPYANRYPVAVRLKADVNVKGENKDHHALECEGDWTWFQGPPDQRNSNSHNEVRGFAESAEAAWLVEQADVYLDAPLFRLVSIVDTPGLNSISAHHDRTTEGCIHRGHAFLVLVRVGPDTMSAATERTLHMITLSLQAQGVPQGQWHDRVFVALNWFRREVGARDEGQAKQSVDRFVQRLRATLRTDTPRAYVVELSPSKLNENSETLLGYPSLSVLKKDIKSFIGIHGVAQRLRTLSRDLEAILTRHKADLEIAAAELSGSSVDDVAHIERTISRLERGGAFRKALDEYIEGALNDVLNPAQILRQLFESDFEGKDDFIEVRINGERCMMEYNRARNELGRDLTEELNSMIAASTRSWLQMSPKILSISRLAEQLPTMASDSFKERIDRVVNGWPNGFKRFWHVISSFEFYANTSRDEVRAAYISSALLDEIQKKTKTIGQVLHANVEEAIEEIEALLRHRLEGVHADSSEKERRRLEIQAEQARIEQFRPIAKRTVSKLNNIAAQIMNNSN